LIDGELGESVPSKQRNTLICEAVLYLGMGKQEDAGCCVFFIEAPEDVVYLGEVWTRVLLMEMSLAPQIGVRHLGTLAPGVDGTIDARISLLLC
jgi:hypothetical protein